MSFRIEHILLKLVMKEYIYRVAVLTEALGRVIRVSLTDDRALLIKRTIIRPSIQLKRKGEKLVFILLMLMLC